MRRVGVGSGLQERIEPVVDAPLQLGDERQGRILLGAAAGVAGRDEQEHDDDADDRHHHQELDQGEPRRMPGCSAASSARLLIVPVRS